MAKSLNKKRSQAQLDAHQEEILQESARYSDWKVKHPWLDDDGETVLWSPARIIVGKVVLSQWFEILMGVIIFGNLVLIIYETDRTASCYPEYAGNINDCPENANKIIWLSLVMNFCLVIYAAEAGLRVFVERLAYFKCPWNLNDMTILSFGLIGEILAHGGPNLAFLRVFRVARLVRVVRVFIVIPELNTMVRCLDKSLKAIFFGSLMIGGVCCILSMILVIFVHPANSILTYSNCERCSRGFSTVFGSMLTLFQQIIAGDSWGTICVHLIEEEPWTAPILIGVFVVVGLGLVNLILAVIVEAATTDSFEKLEDRAKTKAKEIADAKISLLKMCSQLDESGDGLITFDELQKGYHENLKFASTLALMEVTPDDLRVIYGALDPDASGGVDYKELCDQLFRLQSHDYRIVLAHMKVLMSEIASNVKSAVHIIERNAEEHCRALKSIDTRLDLLCQGGLVTLKTDVANLEHKYNAGCTEQHSQQRFAQQATWSEACERVQQVDDQLRLELGSDTFRQAFNNLQQSVQEFMALESSIVMTVEQHNQNLKQHIGRVSKATSEGRAASKSDSIRSWSDLENISAELGCLRISVRQQIGSLLTNLEQCLDDRARAIGKDCGLGDSSRVVGHLLSAYWNSCDEPPKLLCEQCTRIE